jgi:hypothetical protein
MIGNDNDKRTGHYSGFTLKIDNEIVGRSIATTLMRMCITKSVLSVGMGSSVDKWYGLVMVSCSGEDIEAK